MERVTGQGDLDRLVAVGGNLAIAVIDPAAPATAGILQSLQDVAARLPSYVVASLSLPEAAAVAALVGVAEAPALVVFRAGVGLYAGALGGDVAWIEALLRRALSLDMDAVRAEMSRERAAMHGGAPHRACPTTRRGAFPTDA